MMAPIVRIVLRYGVGAVLTLEVGDMLAGDADVVNVIVAGVAALTALATEWWYKRARETGGET